MAYVTGSVELKLVPFQSPAALLLHATAPGPLPSVGVAVMDSPWRIKSSVPFPCPVGCEKFTRMVDSVLSCTPEIVSEAVGFASSTVIVHVALPAL